MTASLSTMTIDYYLKTAAAADGAGQDLTSYYVSAEAPPGRWFGTGLDGLTLEPGTEVEREHALALYRDHADPLTGQQLGRPVMKQRAAPEGAKTPGGQQAKQTRQGVHGFDMTFSPPKSVSTLWALSEPQVQGEVYAAHQQAVEEALHWAEKNVIQSRAGHGGAAQVSVNGVAASLFDHWDSRNGDPQLHTHAVIVNKVQREADGEWVTIDSHTLYRHMVAISEKYNSLLFDRLQERVGAVPESRDTEASNTLTAEAVMAASESADQQDAQTVPNVSHHVELAGIPDDLVEEFSTRARQIEERKDAMVEQYVSRYGKQPSNATVLQFRQKATLDSREAKDTENPETLPEKMVGWRRRAIGAGHNPDDVVKAAVGHPKSVITPDMVDDRVIDSLSSWSLNDASMRRTTFSRANVVASSERVTRLIRCRSAEEREEITSRIVDDALSKAVSLTPDRFPRFDAPEHEDPSVLNRGESVFEHRRTAGVYTTSQIMDEEAFLISRAESDSGPSIEDPEDVAASLDAWRSDEGYPLSEDQRQASAEVLESSAGISAIIGPAGTGKTTTMSAITDAWQQSHGEGSVVGLAPSAVAAGVLGDEIGVSAENTAKWLHESVGPGAAARAERASRNRSQLAQLVADEKKANDSDPWRARKIGELRSQLAADHADQAKYQLRENQLLIVDEASMVAIPQLAELASQAERAGAKVLLVGDPAQLEAVDAGGFLGHMERNMEVSQLDKVWRFKYDWEKDASLALREGREAALQEYADHGRIHGDTDSDAADDAYARWKADHQAFRQHNEENPDASVRSSILIASDNETVEQLNQRAHADRVAAGEVDIEKTVTVRGGTESGVGETLLARKNDRSLRDSNGEFIANGTRLTVIGVRPDGSAEAEVESTGASVTLDKGYLADSVELGYAVTAHRAQGVTVTTGHAVVSPGLSRELFYVAMTRGKESNEAYVQLAESEEPAVATWRGEGDGVVAMHEETGTDDPLEALKGVVGRSQAEKSAHEIQNAEHGWAHDLGRMVHERSYLAWAARTTRTQDWVRENFPDNQAEHLYSDEEWQRLVAADPGRTFKGTPAGHESVAEVLARCDRTAPVYEGPGDMLSEAVPANGVQLQTLTAVDDQIHEQLSVRAAEVRRENPEWYQQLTADYPDGQVPQKQLDAVLVWRAACNQTEADTLLGKEPSQKDHLRPFWDRAQAALRGTPVEVPEPPVVPLEPAPETDPDPQTLSDMAEAFEQMDFFEPEDEHPAEDFEDWFATTDQPGQSSPQGPTL